MRFIKFYRYLLLFWKTEAFILALSIIIMALALVNPYLTKLIIDKAYGNRDFKLFVVLFCSAGAIFVLSGLFTALSNYLNRQVKLKINLKLNRLVFRKLQYLPYNFFQNSTTGEHLYKISYDLDQASRFIADILPQVISLIPKSIFILVIIFFLDRKMALFVLVLTPFLYITPLYFNRRFKKTYKEWTNNSQNIFKKLIEVLSHMQLVKASGKERSHIRKYIKERIANMRLGIINVKTEATGTFFNSFISRVILGAVIFYGGYQVIKGKMTLGVLSAVSIYLTQLSFTEGALVQFFQQVSLGAVSCERLDVILEAGEGHQEHKGAKDMTFSRGDIEFRGVVFNYNSDKLVLDNLNFRIKGGSAVALVGSSGCGKTTISNLIMRLYPLSRGEILVDGINIRGIKADSYYGQVGIVLQEPYLWNDSVENNIRYGREEATAEEIREAARIACVDEFIAALPRGYSAIIGENACKLSEGQKQRIAIARAVIKRPKILILDEALSSVDASIEARIIDSIRKSLKDSTLLVISHRLSTIKSMDLVYFLVFPIKIDIATHDELCLNNSLYRDYLAHQIDEKIIALDPK